MSKFMSLLSVVCTLYLIFLGLAFAQESPIPNVTDELPSVLNLTVEGTDLNTTAQITSNVFNLTSTDPFSERTLVLFKPEVIHRGLIGPILTKIEQKGFKIAAMKLLVTSREQIEAHYADHAGKPFFENLVNRTSNQPVVALVLEGLNAVSEFRRLMGLTDPKKSPLGTLRAEFGMQTERNLLHASDSIENALLEIFLWFSPQEVFSYERAIDKYIYFQ